MPPAMMTSCVMGWPYNVIKRTGNRSVSSHSHLCSQLQSLGAQHDRLHARRAHLIDGRAHRVGGQTAKDGRLARGCLTEAGAAHIAHVHFVHIASGDAGLLDDRLDGDAAQLGCRQARQRRLEAADRCAGGGHDEGILDFARAVGGALLRGNLCAREECVDFGVSGIFYMRIM